MVIPAVAVATSSTTSFQESEHPMPLDWLRIDLMISSILYAFIGVGVLCLSFAVIDTFTPYELWEQIVEHKNMALAIVVAGMFIAVGQIIAAAIHG